MEIKPTIREEDLGINLEELNVALQKNPLAVALTHTDLKQDLEASLAKDTDRKAIEEDQAVLIIRDFRSLVEQYITLTVLSRSMAESESSTTGDGAELCEDIKAYIAVLKEDILKMANDYGRALGIRAEAEQKFEEEADYGFDKALNSASYANFCVIVDQLKELRLTERKRRGIFVALQRDKSAQELPALRTVAHNLQNGKGSLSKKRQKLEADLLTNWRLERVRLAHTRAQHMQHIADIKRGRVILESPSTITILNELHKCLYGNEAYRVAGPTLCGPPGWGKTSLLQEYFRLHGVEPISIDIDPGQSSFTLMARPSLGLEGGLANVQKIIKVIEGMSSDDVRELYQSNQPYFEHRLGIDPSIMDSRESAQRAQETMKAVMQSAFNAELAEVLESQRERKGYVYGSIMKALKANKPIIINEFPELREWSFIHGLLTAIPASDRDAADEPTSEPKEGEPIENPIGWFYNTITGEWTRVKENVRICFTGNIGAEYGTAGAPLALVSRIGKDMINFEGMPAKELCQTIVWPYLCRSDTGDFLRVQDTMTREQKAEFLKHNPPERLDYLDDVTAYRIHFFVNDVFPNIRKKLEKDCRGKHLPISNRVLIDICRAMNPELNKEPCSLDEAIMKALIRPSHALRYRDSLEYMGAVLLATGYLEDYISELGEIIPNFGENRFEEMKAEIKGALKEFKPDTYREKEDTYAGKCPVCSVKFCPCHGEDSQQYVDYLTYSAELARVQLDVRLVRELDAWIRNIAERGEWNYFLDASFEGVAITEQRQLEAGSEGESEEARSVVHQADYADKISEHLLEFVERTKQGSSLAPDLIPHISAGVKKMYLERDKLDEEWQQSILKFCESGISRCNSHNLEGNEAFRKALEVLVHLKSIFPNLDLSQSLVKKLGTLVPDMRNIKLLWLLKKLTKEKTSLDEAIQARLKKKEDFSEELKQLRVQLLKNGDKKEDDDDELEEEETSKRKQRKKKPRRRSSTKRKALLAAIPEFEVNYDRIMDSLEKIERLIDLKLIRVNEVRDILEHIESEMNKVVQSGKLPEGKSAYIAVIKTLSRIKGVNLQKALDFFFEDHTPTLPPLRNF